MSAEVVFFFCLGAGIGIEGVRRLCTRVLCVQ